MKRVAMVTALSTVLLVVSCRTADFKVVDALSLGVTSAEARATIASFGFERRARLERPDVGWPGYFMSDGRSRELARRALVAEVTLLVTVGIAEYYPVQHGLLGFGELYLFYDTNDRLVQFYRYQIN